MKYLVIYRGKIGRFQDLELLYNNFINKIHNPLIINNNSVDIILTSYDNESYIMDKYKDKFKPIDTHIMKYNNSTQVDNFIFVLSTLKNYYENYDRILILRYDICYKKNIMSWDIYNKKGIFFPYKEDSKELFKNHNYVSDTIILIDKEYFIPLFNTLNDIYPLHISKTPILLNGHLQYPFLYTILHDIKSILEYKNINIPINFLIEGYFQSNTEIPLNDIRLSPLYIMMHKNYYNNDTYMLYDHN